MNLGLYIKKQREELGWTLRDLAEKSAISDSRLAEIERGRSYRTENPTRPSRENLASIANALNVPFDLLLALAGYEREQAPVELSPAARVAAALFETIPMERQELALRVLSAFVFRDDT